MPWRQIPIPISDFPGGTRPIAMKRVPNGNCVCAILATIALLSCSAFAYMMIGPRAPKTRAGVEPFITFRLLDGQLSILDRQSAALQKTIDSPRPGNLKT